MKKKEIKLKPKKETRPHNKMVSLFRDKKKRFLVLFVLVLPLLIGIFIFGRIVYIEANSIFNLAGKENTDLGDEYRIPSMGYVLRDNATDYQKELFSELKQAVEGGADSTTIAGLVCENFVADYFTWTNKKGQYDVGGLSYFYSGKNENLKFKTNIYSKSRDGFYKYLNNYINDYGSSNLLEVSDVKIDKSNKTDYQYIIHEANQLLVNEEGSTYWAYGDSNFDCYEVTCSWNYKEGSSLDINKFVSKLNFIVIKRNDRFEIVEISEKPIDARPQEKVENEEAGENEEVGETGEVTEIE